MASPGEGIFEAAPVPELYHVALAHPDLEGWQRELGTATDEDAMDAMDARSRRGLEQRFDKGLLAVAARYGEMQQALHVHTSAVVALLRTRGVSWGKIGACLGISAQAAQQRFARDVDELRARRTDDRIADWLHSVDRRRKHGPASQRS